MSEGNNGRVAGPRCIALVGPFASGKTTLLEAILARTGAITRQGRSPRRITIGDASPEARAHQISVEANIAETDFMGDQLTFLDCPAPSNVPSRRSRSSPASTWRWWSRRRTRRNPRPAGDPQEPRGPEIPRILFLNKLDKTEGGVRQTLKTFQRASGVPLVFRHIRSAERVVTGFIDLALERAFVYREHAASEVIDMGDADRAREAEARFTMLETLADYDDGLMEQLLEDIQPDRDQIFKDLVEEMRAGAICPVLIGSAEKANGIGRLLKAIRHEAPDVAETCKRLGVPDRGDGIVQVLKTLHTTHGGKLSIARVLGGTIRDGAELTGPDGPVGRASGVFRIMGQQANKREPAAVGGRSGSASSTTPRPARR